MENNHKSSPSRLGSPLMTFKVTLMEHIYPIDSIKNFHYLMMTTPFVIISTKIAVE